MIRVLHSLCLPILMAAFMLSAVAVPDSAEGIGVQVRIVPQLGCPGNSVISPDGRWGAALDGARLSVVDINSGALVDLFIQKEFYQSYGNAAFSPDSRLLAVTGTEGGLLLNLQTFEPRPIPDLNTGVVTFTSDSKRIIVATQGGGFATSQGLEKNRKAEIKLVDLGGKLIKSFPMQMAVPTRISIDGDTVRVSGMDGCITCESRSRVFPVTQTVNLDTAETSVDKGRMGEKIERAPKQSLPGCSVAYDETFTGLWYDENSDFLIVAGKGKPEGGVLKVWDLRNIRMAGTLGTSNEVKPIGFVKPGVFAAYAWFNRKDVAPPLAERGNKMVFPTVVELLAEFDLATGERKPIAEQDTVPKPYPGNRTLSTSVLRFDTVFLSGSTSPSGALIDSNTSSNSGKGVLNINGDSKLLRLQERKVGLQTQRDTLQVHIVTLPEMKVLLTLEPFEKDYWLIHTPDGRWCGTAAATERIFFYRGAEQLSPNEIGRLKDDEGIRKMLREELQARDPSAK
jgi:hypothetical protein